MNSRAPEIAATLAALRSIHIETERDREVRHQLVRLLQVDEAGVSLPVPIRFTAGLETRGLAVIEAAGGGKTTAIRRVLCELPALGLNPGTGLPRYLHIQVPNPATQKSVGLEILRATGFHGISERTKVWELWDLVRRRLSLLEVVVLWIDEAHDLFRSKSEREINDMLRTMKKMMQGETGVIVILSGTSRLSEITSFDPQVDRRFTKVVPKDLAYIADSADLERVLRHYCAFAKLELKLERKLAGRLIHGSRARFGRAIETIINAIECALNAGDDTLTIEHFVEAWGMQEGCPPDKNVFVASDWMSLVLDAEANTYEAARSAPRRQARGRC